MAVFFQFLLVVFLAIVFIVGIVIYRVYRQIHDAAHQFKQQMGGGQQQSNRQRQPQSHYGDDEVVIDQRNPEEAGRKIFTKKDGEYVDFKEE